MKAYTKFVMVSAMLVFAVATLAATLVISGTTVFAKTNCPLPADNSKCPGGSSFKSRGIDETGGSGGQTTYGPDTQVSSGGGGSGDFSGLTGGSGQHSTCTGFPLVCEFVGGSGVH